MLSAGIPIAGCRDAGIIIIIIIICPLKRNEEENNATGEREI